VDHSAVGGTIVTGRSIYARDPQSAEIAFFQLTVNVCILTRFHDLLISYSIQFGFTAKIAFSSFKNLFMSVMGGYTSFNPWHIVNLLLYGISLDILLVSATLTRPDLRSFRLRLGLL
jgi:hypothetical protein